VLLSHKYLLHHAPCTSALHDFTTGTFFNRLIDDGKASDNTRHRGVSHDGTPFLAPPHHIRRVVLCSGAVYYKLSQV
jgi:2-oxoglutarate dehydrogenase E1 component